MTQQDLKSFYETPSTTVYQKNANGGIIGHQKDIFGAVSMIASRAQEVSLAPLSEIEGSSPELFTIFNGDRDENSVLAKLTKTTDLLTTATRELVGYVEVLTLSCIMASLVVLAGVLIVVVVPTVSEAGK